MAVENVSSEDYKMSSYNSAGNTIKRLDNLWEAAHKDVRVGNYLDWNILLDRIWLEVAGDLKEDAPENKQMDELNREIVKLLPLASGNMHGFNKRESKDILKMSKQYLLLRKKEMLVKRIENKLGLGKAYVDEMEDDWD
jgi:hypothetical protein